MAEPQDRPGEGSESGPPAKKAAAKKAPAKKAPAKKAPAKKAPAKKAVAKKAPAKKVPSPRHAPQAATEAPALNAAPAPAAAPPSPHESFGRGHRIPLSLGLAAAGLVALVLSRLRRG